VLGATVTFVDTQSTERNGIVTYRTKLAFNDAPEALRAGMTATIAIDTVVTPDVLVIPQASVAVATDGTTQVLVLIDGEPVRRDVVLGMTDTRGGVLVESGLSVGEQVVRTP
jgi:multidrug efflux pump subunit AcrA (membrane-fusion protein)